MTEETKQETAPEIEPPPRGVASMALVRWALILLTATAAVFSWWSFAHADAASQSEARYYCPMHPTVTSHDPGECPICHMTLEPIPKDRQAAPSASASASAAVAAPPHHHDAASAAADEYTCPMHPEVVSPTPGSCPKCHMKLVKKAKKQESSEPPAGKQPDGTLPVELSLDRVQAIGVRTAVAEETPAQGSLRVAAAVEAPESGVAEVHVRAPGFVERIAVKETGVRVRRGQPLLSLYSPDIYQAESELVAVKDWPVAGQGTSSLDRAKRKLELLGVSSGTSEQILKKGEPIRAVGIGSPISGYVTKKNVVLGSYVSPETTLYEIVDLSKVYIVASVFQRDAAIAKVGMEGRFTAPGVEKPVTAKVDLIYPKVDLEARTTRVRLQVKNADLALLPGQYGWVEFSQPARKVVSVPRDAVIDTGLERYVFVVTDEGRYSPRTVTLGSDLGTDRIEVVDGLEPGQRVVSGATFLIDSESRLKASLAGKGQTPANPEP